jgi:predicted NBD/HSP70 family sugar kinase
MERDAIDLSALDPQRDEARWDAFVEATLRRVDPVLAARREDDPLGVIARWTRPVLAAAAIIVLMLVPAEMALDARERHTEQVRRLVVLSVEVFGGAAPSGDAFVQALGPVRGVAE